MNAKQFAWLYLIENGTAGLCKSFYGGYEPADIRMREAFSQLGWDDTYRNPFRKQYLDEIKQHGVNWGETQSPKSDMVSEFQGTFCDATQKEMLVGTLKLYGGIEQTWTAEALEVANVFEMMAQVHMAPMKFYEIFGESA
jgi:hypothetical protein